MKTFISNLFIGGESFPLTRATRIVATALAVPLAIFEVWLAYTGIVTPIQLGLIFMCPLLVIAFLTTSGVTGVQRTGPFEVGMAIAVAAAGAYMLWESPRYGAWILGISQFTLLDQIAGAILIIGTMIILKRCVGPGMTVVVLLLVAYLAFGHHFSGFLYHREFQLREMLEQSVISVNGGLFGAPVTAAAIYVYLFVVFGKILQVSGGGQFFYDLAASFAGRQTGGVAKVAVVSSGLFGMISGSPTSDVVTTGTITIPMMKRMGYAPHIAAAIETVACVGGSIMPPVMGAVVFLMVEFTGISYGEIIGASVIIAGLYYFAIFLQVHQFSARDGIGRLDESQIPRFGAVLAGGWTYILPLALLVAMIEQDFTPQYSVTLATILTIVLSWFNKNREFRIGPARLVVTVTDAATMLAPLIAAVAGAGLVEQVLNVTGLGSKISFEMFALAQGNAVLIMLFAALVTIVFGMGMPVPAVYALAAILLAPGMIQAGFDVLPAHLFLVWFAVASHLTPPIAVAAYVAATIANAGPMRVSVWASRLGLLAFMLPFAFMLRPGLLMAGDWLTVISDTLLTIVAVILLAAASIAYFNAPIASWLRTVLLAAGLVTMFAVNLPLLAWAAGLVGLLLLWRNFFSTGRDRSETERGMAQVK